jgi:glycerol kinase
MTKVRAVLAIDQGGQSTRATVWDREGRCLGEARRPVESFESENGVCVEQEPEAVLRSVEEAVAEAVADAGVRPEAAGLATQRASIVCFDVGTNQPLTPVISWQDRRAAEWLTDLALDGAEIRELTGLFPSAHYGASKIRWCLDHLPAVAAAAGSGTLRAGPLASFIARFLSRVGGYFLDPANGARTLLWDLRAGDYSERLLNAFEIPRTILPMPTANRHPFGVIATPLGEVPLTVMTGDQSAALFGMGTPPVGRILLNLGTGAFLQAVTARPEAVDRRLLQSRVWTGSGKTVEVAEGTVNGAGSAIVAMVRGLGLDPYTVATETGRWLAEIEGPPVFLNGLGGLGSPYWVPQFTSEFVGEGDDAAKLVAVFESIAFLVTANAEAMETCLPEGGEIIVGGGLAAVDGLCRRIATLTGRTLARPPWPELTSVGLGFLTAGTPSEWRVAAPQAVFPPLPDPALAARYARFRTELARRLPAV